MSEDKTLIIPGQALDGLTSQDLSDLYEGNPAVQAAVQATLKIIEKKTREELLARAVSDSLLEDEDGAPYPQDVQDAFRFRMQALREEVRGGNQRAEPVPMVCKPATFHVFEVGRTSCSCNTLVRAISTVREAFTIWSQEEEW